MGEPTLLFGLGANKGGSSWLYSYLAAHPECHFSTIKELHYFDTSERDAWRYRVKVLDRNMADVRKKQAKAEEANRRAVLEEHLIDRQNWQTFLAQEKNDDAFFLSFLGRGTTDRKIIGDITPSYSLLKAETYQRMYQLLASVKFIFLLRDPIARLWSNIRMLARRTISSPDQYENRVKEIADDHIAKGDVGLTERSDYKQTMTTLFSVVPRANVHLEFYERLFDNNAIEHLTRFLGVSAHPADFGRKMNFGRPVPLAPSYKRIFRQMLKPQYDYVYDFFDGQIPDQWKANMSEVAR